MAVSARFLPAFVAACMLAGCVLPTASKTKGGGVATEGTIKGAIKGTKIAPGAAQAPTSGQVGASGNGIISNNGSGIVSNNSGSLTGFVRCPASLISNNGGSIISDNGLGYHVFADADVPVKGATVKLLDAAGAPVKGADGTALTAKTDDQGHYVFTGVVPTKNLILTVGLGDKGQLQAIAPKTGGNERKSDLNVISTLTTRYILTQYVKGQTDPQTTLDKLPADVEADTRAKAQAAFTASGQATPTDLQDATVTQVVTTLRQKDTTFDAQMETVKKLLVAAGLSDLGNGQKATDVLLNPIKQVVAAPDGSVYLFDGVLWRVSPQGMLVRLTLPGPADAAPEGKLASDSRLGLLRQLALDPQGRVWFLTDAALPKLWRIETDGKLKDMTRGVPNMSVFTPTGNDDFYAFSRTGQWGSQVNLYEAKGTAAPAIIHSFTGAEASTVFQFQQLARDSQGVLIGAGLIDVIPKSYRFDVATKTLTKWKSAVTDGVGTVALDGNGTLFYDEMASHVVHQITPDGTDTVLTGLTHLPYTHGVSRLPDGTIVIKGAKFDSSLYTFKGGQETLYAGKESQTGQTGNAGGTTALKKPTGLAVATDGTLYVCDDGALLRIHATEGTSTLVAVDALKDGTTSIVPGTPRVGADGFIYFIGKTSTYLGNGVPLQGIWRVKPGAAAERVHTSDRHVQDFILNADGSITIAETTPAGLSGTTDRVVVRAADGTVSTLIAEDQLFINDMLLARDAQGRLIIKGNRKGAQPNTYDFYRIFRHTAQAGIEMLAADTFWPEARNAKGQEACGWYYSQPEPPKAIRLYTPATNKLETLTGTGARFFAGTGVDDGVLKPVQACFDGQGNLFFLDPDNKQVKRIAGSEL